MDQDRTHTIEEIISLIIRMQLLYSFLSPPSKRKLKKACNDNAMKKLIKIKDLHKYIDPSFPNSRCVLFILPEDCKQTVTVDSFSTLLKNCSVLLKKELALN